MTEYYWDNSATTRVSAEAAAAVMTAMREQYGNPSSLHRKGVEAEKLLREARRTVAQALKAKEKEIFFTSGGTESDNLALTGLFHSNHRRGRHIISTAVEHPAVLQTLAHLESHGAQVTLLAPDSTGAVTAEAVAAALRADTVLVSVMLVNNETGARTDVAAISRAVRRVSPDTLIHTDAVQAFGKLPLTVGELGVDALSLSGHKLHGPKGVGALYLREGVRCGALFHGGGQENSLRPGTENLPGIAGLAAAVREADPARFMALAAGLRTQLLDGLTRRGVAFEINGDPEGSVPYVVNLSFPGTLSEVLLHSLESKGIFVSAGSACSSKKKSHSAVLTAMGLPERRLESALRFSFSMNNLEEDLEAGLDLLAEAVREITDIMNRRQAWKR